MNLKDILVHLDQTPASRTRVEAAILLARQHGARVRGIYIYAAPKLEAPNSALAQVRTAFQQQAEEAGVASAWSDIDLGFSKIGVVEMLGYQACFTDLIVVSPSGLDKSSPSAGIARLLNGSGCPVLVVPDSCPLARLGERVMVAWKAGPKASRAMRDALPVLAAANHLDVVSVGDAPGFSSEITNLQAYLQTHKLKAQFERLPKSGLNIGDALLNRMVDHCIDLVIVGVHVTRRRGQLELGEVANSLLNQMTTPMLMAN